MRLSFWRLSSHRRVHFNCKVNQTFCNKKLRKRGVQKCFCSGDWKGFIVLECDGILFDTQMEAHRVAFNSAFRDLGLECANWSPVIYHDLLYSSDGTYEGMVYAFFEKIGWPMAVATSERDNFVKQVLKTKDSALQQLTSVERDKIYQLQLIGDKQNRGYVPLRDGVEDVIADALQNGCSVVVLLYTNSNPQDDIFNSAVQQMSPDLLHHLLLVPTIQPQDSLAQGLKIAEQQNKLQIGKQLIALQEMSDIGLAPSISGTGGKQRQLIQVLQDLMQSLELDTPKSILMLGAQNWVLEAAKQLGIYTIAIPNGMSRRGSFPGSKMKMEGFGVGGGLTWSRIQAILSNQ